MPRPVVLFTNAWADTPLEEVVVQVNEWGYQGVELCCWGDHFEVQRALSDEDYCQHKLELLNHHDLQLLVLSNHRVSQAVCDPIDRRHQRLLPDYVWGDGSAEGVRQRAAEEMVATIQAAQKLGVGVVAGFSGSPLWSYVAGWPPPTPEMIDAGLQEFARRWTPILDACRETGIRYALEVHPGQIAFDLYSAEMALEAVHGREELGFTFDPAHLHWQGVDPIEFLRRFPERIYHVHIRDVVLVLDGRASVLCSYLPPGDRRRGFQFRSPGRGGLDWEAIIRGLNEINYEGPLSVDWSDSGMNRAYGAEEACRFVKRLDFET